MQKHLLVLDHNNESIGLADEMMYYGYSAVQITSDYNAVYGIAKNDKPDLVILDFLMMDEKVRNVCQNLKEDADLAGVPVIVLSGNISKQDDMLQYPCDAVFMKPYDEEQLASRIQSLIQLKAAV